MDEDKIARAMAIYAKVVNTDMAEIAQEIMVPYLHRACADASLVMDVARDDPAAPGCATAHEYVLHELRSLTAVFVGREAEHAKACEFLNRMIRAMETAGPVWDRIDATARARPPPRRHE